MLLSDLFVEAHRRPVPASRRRTWRDLPEHLVDVGARVYARNPPTRQMLSEIGKWGMCHASDGMTKNQNTAWGLVRDLAGGLDIGQLPDGDTSIRIQLTDVEESPVHYIHVRDGKAEVCNTDLGIETDVALRSSLSVMTRVWYGEIDLVDAIEGGQVQVDAAPIYTRRIKSWLRISSFTTGNPGLGNSG